MLHIFIDTSALIALGIASEEHHQKCRDKYEEYRKENAFFFTNHLVLTEFYTKVLTAFGKHYLLKSIKMINKLVDEGKLRVFLIDSVIFKDSEAAMIKFSEHKLSFTDCSIYASVKTYKLDEVFTLDEGFKKVGLETS
ncbi:hypothetical protein A3I51_02315 [Candidatus Gottesmanbacteria bacterium RIFCSPLOWO2_02_FULL_38_8]|uniref:PIN domain-containing protein n=1 Tax=Candidatus Gottesmanbacteria bacterium RIFCSPLOWO2_02_FULL_38_8 TaxID=1798397 RepID=A0A1F6B2F1_9BACT|nr:MAG: hypothetical protein A3I51_02315 [Candidatus Gottesmanbacteria bacterium RIFCSPLOWO2_02_FULL_38_8]